MELATGPLESNETPIFTTREDCLLARRLRTFRCVGNECCYYYYYDDYYYY